MYGHAYTQATISNMTKAVEDHVKEFHERALNKRYAVIYMDATYLNVRRDSVSKEALHILIGITPEDYKEMLQDIYQKVFNKIQKELLDYSIKVTNNRI